MKIVVFGASGGTGRCLVRLALQKGHHVTAAVRDPQAQALRHDRLRFVRCDVTDQHAVRSAVDGQDAVLCALGGPRKGVTLYSVGAGNVVRAMQEQRATRLAFLSNYGVLEERGQGVMTRLMLLLGKVALKDTLADHRRALDILDSSGLEWVAVRPMALTNGAGTTRYRVSTDGLPRGATHIARADVAHFMLNSVLTRDFVGKVPAIAY
jgi:putative NADH-flavin reductase